MKNVIILLICLLNMSAFAALEVLSESDHHVFYSDRHGDYYTYFKGLENDLFQNLKITSSNGPKWKDVIEEVLKEENDFHEWASYYGERLGNQCQQYYVGDSSSAYNTWKLNWKAVKKTQGSSKSLFYIVQFITVIHYELGDCELLDAQYVFENKFENGEFFPLGMKSETLPAGL